MPDRSRAKANGEGALNGQVDVVCRLSLAQNKKPDGQAADCFRIRIWNVETSRRIYQPQPGADDDADPSSKLTGGSITSRHTIERVPPDPILSMVVAADLATRGGNA